MARSIESFDMFSARAAMMAARRREFMAGSGMPSLAATVISRASLLNSLDFTASCRPLRCMMFLNCECPAIGAFLGRAGALNGDASCPRLSQAPRLQALLGRILLRLKYLASLRVVAGLVPATPIILALCLNALGRRDEPGDDAGVRFNATEI